MLVTLVIIGITVAVSFLAWSNRRLAGISSILWPPAVRRGKHEYWRLASRMA